MLGGAVSVGYLGLSLFGGFPCPYCMVANAANVAWVVMVFATSREANADHAGTPVAAARGPGKSRSGSSGGKGASAANATAATTGRAGWALPAGLLVFLVVGGSLLLAQSSAQSTANETAEKLRREDAAKMAGNVKPAENAPVTPPGINEFTRPSAANPDPTKAVSPPEPAKSAGQSAAAAKPFTGRWRRGPEQAAVRIVVLTDYQCPDCKLIEQQIEEQIALDSKESPRISFSMKHFPFCTACNPKAPNLHANACWAARAAEAAGILHGEAGFWKMHDWLFARGGAFTDAELDVGLRQLGFERGPFLAVMQSNQTLDRVKADIAEGWELGLYRTPMIFINGVELRGWMAPRSIEKTVQQVLAANPPVRGSEADQPPKALDKYVQDWRESPPRQIAEDPARPVLGNRTAPIRVVVWGDLQEPGTCEADSSLRALAAARTDVRYEYRHWPFNKACNPKAPRDQFALSCLAARAAEVGGFLHGADGYWKAHEWLVNNRERLSEQALRDGVPALGMDETEFMTTLENPTIAARLRADAEAGSALGLTGLPTVFVNGRLVPRWKMDDRNILPLIIEAAATP